MEQTICVPAFQLTNSEGRSVLEIPEIKFQPGKVYAVAGPSGAGKSLFLNHLFWESGCFETEKRHYYLMQDPGTALTVHLKIGSHFSDCGLNKESIPAQWKDKLNRYPASFSGGERQALLADMVLGQNPNFLVCDEPSSQLSESAAEKLFQTIMEVRETNPFTLLFVSHNWAQIRQFADVLIFIREGKLEYVGSVKEGLHLDPTYMDEGTLDAGEKSDQSFPVLRVENLSWKIGDRWLFKSFNWSSDGHPWWWVQGPNGTGKSMLAKILAGLIIPDEGNLLLDDRVLPWGIGPRRDQALNLIQYAFQLGKDLFNPGQKMGEQLRFFFKERKSDLYTYMAWAGLDEGLLERFPLNFSLGEKQRFNLIRALSSHPKVLICDETLASLDRGSQQNVIEFIKHLQKQLGITVLFISHDPEHLKWVKGPVLQFPVH